MKSHFWLLFVASIVCLWLLGIINDLDIREHERRLDELDEIVALHNKALLLHTENIKDLNDIILKGLEMDQLEYQVLYQDQTDERIY